MEKIDCISQENQRNCGLACLRTILNYYDIKLTESDLENLYLDKMRFIKEWGFYALDLALIIFNLNISMNKNLKVHLFSKLSDKYGPLKKVDNLVAKYGYDFKRKFRMKELLKIFRYYLMDKDLPVIGRTTMFRYFKTKEIIGRGHFLVFSKNNRGEISVCDPIYRLKPHLLKNKTYTIEDLDDFISIALIIE